MRYLLIIFCFMIVIACSPQTDYKDGDIAAILFGKEVTVKELRALYGMSDDKLPGMINYYVIEEVVMAEAQQMNIDVKKEALEEFDSIYTSNNFGDNQEFFEKQSDYLGITIEEYYEDYFKERLRRGEYVTQYINELFDYSEYSDPKELDQKINLTLGNLVERHEAEIEILIQ